MLHKLSIVMYEIYNLCTSSTVIEVVMFLAFHDNRYDNIMFSAMIKATIYIFLQRAGGRCEPVKDRILPLLELSVINRKAGTLYRTYEVAELHFGNLGGNADSFRPMLCMGQRSFFVVKMFPSLTFILCIKIIRFANYLCISYSKVSLANINTSYLANYTLPYKSTILL